jgi:MFS transporter, ACS family, D-galactonate transporter
MQVQERLSPALWRLLALLSFSVVINYIDRSNLSIAAPLLKDEFGLSASQLGILLSSFFWTYTLFQIVSGWAVDRFDVNWVIAAGFVTWSLATTTTALVHGFAVLLVIRLILGIGESVAFPSYSKILARHCAECRRGLANALIMAGMMLGPALGTFAGGMLMARFGWRPFFFVLGLVSLIWLLPWLKWMPREPTAAEPVLRQNPGLLEILRQRSAWGACAGQFCGNYVWYFLVTWLPFYLVRERDFSMDRMARIGGSAYLFAAVSATLSGWLSDRWIASGGTPTRVRKTFMFVGYACAGISLVLCVASGPDLFVVLLMVASASFGIYASNTWAIAQTLAGPQAAGKWTGLQNFVANLAGVVVPALTGFIVERTGHFFWAFAITAVVALLGAILWVFVVGPIKQVAWTQPKDSDLAQAAAGTA